MRAFLALAGSIAIECRVVDWVADHRKHHQFSDEAEDPHSPWAYGTNAWAVTRGLVHAHIGWIFTYAGTDTAKYAPDLIADKAIDRISRWWPVVATVSLGLPAAVGWIVDGPEGAIRAFFWASLVRVALVHRMTWTINSANHVWGKRPFATRDRATNVAVLARFTGGESRHISSYGPVECPPWRAPQAGRDVGDHHSSARARRSSSRGPLAVPRADR